VREIRDAGHELGHHGWVHELRARSSRFDPWSQRDLMTVQPATPISRAPHGDAALAVSEVTCAMLRPKVPDSFQPAARSYAAPPAVRARDAPSPVPRNYSRPTAVGERLVVSTEHDGLAKPRSLTIIRYIRLAVEHR
jgi:hypothetical protein